MIKTPEDRQADTHRAPLNDIAICDEYDFLDEVDELVERFNNDLTLRSMTFSERYRKGKAGLACRVKAVFGKPSNFLITLRKHDAISGQFSLERHGPRHHPHDVGRVAVKDADGNIADYDGNQLIVLVHIVKMSKEPEIVVPSLVGFQPPNEPVRFGRNVFEISDAGFTEFLFVPPYGEAVVTSDFFTVESNECTHHLVESRTKVMDCIPQNERQIGRRISNHPECKDAFSSSRIIIRDVLEGRAILEGFPSAFEVSKVAFCSFNL